MTGSTRTPASMGPTLLERDLTAQGPSHHIRGHLVGKSYNAFQYQAVCAHTPRCHPSNNRHHVQDAIKFARAHGIKISAKSGGHSYANYGLGGENGHMIIELDRMYGVELHADDTATIKAGSRLGHVAIELFKRGKRAISHGTCPGVGLAGHALHGGYGFSSHKYGLALDWIIRCKVVQADGSLDCASETENADLFWALRGAGSSFGIVVEFDIETFTAPKQLTWFKVKMGIGRDRGSALSGLRAWQKYVERGIPEDMLVRIFIPENSEKCQILEAMYYGSEEEARKILQPLEGPLWLDWDAEFSHAGSGGWLEHLSAFNDRLDGRLDLTGSNDTVNAHYASSLVTRHIPDSSLEAFVDYWFSARKQDTRKDWWIQMDIHGDENSAVSKVANDATVYPHRDKMWLFQFFDQTHQQADLDKTYRLLNGFMNAIKDNMDEDDWGRYANYIDSELGREEALEQYYAENLPRLRTLKAKFDPKDSFHSPQSVTVLNLE